MNDKPRFTDAIPILPAVDLEKAIHFYERKLGFRKEFRAEGYAALSRDGVEIHLWLCGDRRIAESTSCRINVQGIDELYEECRAQEIIHPSGALVTKPWGLREFTVVDTSGNSITFAEEPAVA